MGYIPKSSSTCTDPISDTFERSFRIRSVIMRFSAFSFSLVASWNLYLASSASFIPLRIVPLIGCVMILFSVFLINRSGEAETIHRSLALKNAENGIGDISFNLK